MAKDVNLDQLLARVTGAAVPRPAAPAKPTEAVTRKGPPLPVGKVQKSQHLTPTERQGLASVGWKDGDPIPRGMAQIFEEVQREAIAESAAENLPLPVSPDTPPVVPTIIHESQLSPAQRAEVRRRMAEVLDQEKATQAATRKELRESVTIAPGVREAIKQAERVGNSRVIIEDDRPQVVPTPPVAPAPAAPAAPAAGTPAVQATNLDTLNPADPVETGATGSMTHCPHCRWVLSVDDIPEPPPAERLTFLHALLGQKPYTKDYPIFAGNISVTFRTLTTAESDAIHQQAYADRAAGQLPTELDFWEQVNRYRMYLQIQRLEGVGLLHELPDGLDRVTNPNATAFWEVTEPLAPGETMLPRIKEWLLTHVLPTETINRIVYDQCARFNRLVVRMEALADNADFWQETASVS